MRTNFSFSYCNLKVSGLKIFRLEESQASSRHTFLRIVLDVLICSCFVSKINAVHIRGASPKVVPKCESPTFVLKHTNTRARQNMYSEHYWKRSTSYPSLHADGYVSDNAIHLMEHALVNRKQFSQSLTYHEYLVFPTAVP